MPAIHRAAVTLVLLALATVSATAQQTAACTDYACIMSAFYDNFRQPPVALRDITVDVVGCASTSATCTDYSGGWALYDAARDVPSTTSLCCAYRRFADAAGWTGDTAAAPATIATVADRLLSDQTVGVGGVSDVLAHSASQPPISVVLAPLALTFTRSDVIQTASGAVFAATAAPAGASPERVAIRVRTDGSTNRHLTVGLSWSATAAGNAKAFSVRVLFRCNSGTPDPHLPIPLTATASVPSGAAAEVETVAAYCGRSFAVGPIVAAGRAFTLVLARVDGTLLPAGVHTLMALPVSADIVLAPTNPEPQDWRYNGDSTVLIVCPAGTLQQPSTLSVQQQAQGLMPATQRTMAGLTLYGFEPTQTHAIGTYWAGTTSSGGIHTFTLTSQDQVWGARASVIRTKTILPGPVTMATNLLLHGQRLRCNVPSCPAPAAMLTPIFDPDAATFALPTVRWQVLDATRGNGCAIQLTCPAGTQNLVLSLNFGSYRGMARIGGAPLPATLSSGTPAFFGSVPRDGPGGATLIGLEAGFYYRFFTAYPGQWGIAGEQVVMDGRLYSVTNIPQSLPDFGGNVTCAAQPRCPTPNVSSIAMRGGTVARFGVPEWVPWPADSACAWRITCATGLLTISQDRGVGLASQWSGAARWNVSIQNGTVDLSATAAASAFAIGFVARCGRTPSTTHTLSDTVSLSESEPAGGGGPPVPPGPPATTQAPTTTLAPATSTPTSGPVGTTTAPAGTTTPITLSSTPAAATTTTVASTTTHAGTTWSVAPGVTTTTTAAPSTPGSTASSTTTSAPSTAGSTSTPVPPATTGLPVTSPPPPPPPGAGRTRTLTRTVSQTLLPPAPVATPVVAGLAGGAAGDSAGFLGTGIGGTVLAVGAGAFFALCSAAGLFLYRRWRRRRRSGDAPEPLATPLRDRTNTYRWYEDAEAVAQDIERRGDDVQTHDTEGQLYVPALSTTTTVAAAPGATAASAQLDALLRTGGLSFAAEGPRADAALDSYSSAPSTVAASPGNPLRRNPLGHRTSV